MLLHEKSKKGKNNISQGINIITFVKKKLLKKGVLKVVNLEEGWGRRRAFCKERGGKRSLPGVKGRFSRTKSCF